MRILIVDDQSAIRSALRLLLEQQPAMTVVGEVCSSENLLAQVEATGPDVALLDWELPGLHDTYPPMNRVRRVLSELRERYPNLRLIALSGRPEACQAALIAGADVFVSKGDPAESLLGALQAIAEGHVHSCFGGSGDRHPAAYAEQE